MATDGHEMAIPLITDPAGAGVSARSKVASYFALTKPRIIELLLITTVPSMVLAAGRWPGLWPVVATLIGGSLSAGGANALNNYVDRDIDQIMKRTRSRPLARHEVPPSNALVFGIALGVAGFVWLWVTTNLLAAAIATAALLFYVFVYTLKLKRTSTHNIVIGGAAGAAPALVGWAAVNGSLDLPAWVLFLVVFYWTPPHFWALAIRYRDDYEKAGVPMLPVVAGVEATTRQDAALHRAHGGDQPAPGPGGRDALDLSQRGYCPRCLVPLGHLARLSPPGGRDASLHHVDGVSLRSVRSGHARRVGAMRRLIPGLLGLTMLCAACGSDEVEPFAVVASSNGSIGTGEQRVLFGLVDPETDEFLASPDREATVTIRDENGSPLDTYPMEFIWTVPDVRGLYVAHVDIPEAATYQATIDAEGLATAGTGGFRRLRRPALDRAG